MIKPHGDKLVNQELSDEKKESILKELDDFIKIQVDIETCKTLKNIASGVLSPLVGFMNENDTLQVLKNMRLENDIAWPFPIILDVNKIDVEKLKVGDTVILIDPFDKPAATLKIQDIYDHDQKFHAKNQYGTLDLKHPGVAKTLSLKEKLIGGEIKLLNRVSSDFPELDYRPGDTRAIFKQLNWNKVVAFQTRNPPHLGHEYLQKTALTFADGLFINPVVGKKKKGDFKDELIIDAYKTLIKFYYPNDRVFLSILETEMRYAGPREAIFHAIIRKNFGCNYIIIGRDHAGVGNYYGPYDAQKIFENFPDLGIEPIFFDSFSWCNKCNSVVNEKTCSHPTEEHSSFSGTKIRDLINAGELPSTNIMRREVIEVILKYKNPFCE